MKLEKLLSVIWSREYGVIIDPDDPFGIVENFEFPDEEYTAEEWTHIAVSVLEKKTGPLSDWARENLAQEIAEGIQKDYEAVLFADSLHGEIIVMWSAGEASLRDQTVEKSIRR